MGTGAGALVKGVDPLAVVRRWEASQGRRLVDPSLAGWDDLDSEALVMARDSWGVSLPGGTQFWRRRRYLSFSASGAPQRLVEVQLACGDHPVVQARHRDLAVARALGNRYWIYVLDPAADGQAQLWTVQDPARCPWQLAKAVDPHEGLWVLPLRQVSAASVLLAAA
ncbi:hypothetical protein [Quadrisphaera sp. INWT6]|uniref:hypothetical protein n=1 Tax=Quadrisphaera sp. INWT6 TaxID=2596917 RepID=UPI0018921119|nr:hypothetical protein [Quadrisphaera sp. INWT6]MBF5083087.1 hypothetical protein [Quadrisphaera sp. INWT6]